MTTELMQQLDSAEWADPQWIVALAEKFAGRFFEAIDRFDAGKNPGDAWQAIQESMRSRRTSVLQDLVSGMISHIVHDLPLALVDVGMHDPTGRSHIADYHRVNDILGRAIRPLSHDIERHFDPRLRWLDRLFGATGQFLTDYGIRLSRATAWYNAERLGDAQGARDARAAIEAGPQKLIQELFDPDAIVVRAVVRTISTIISLGRRWPRPPVPRVPAFEHCPSQRYYFGVGTGSWTGTFRFAIVSWRAFARAKLGLENRFLAVGMSVLMTIFRHAKIKSTIDAYPDQGAAGIATNDVRISLLGVTLYVLSEQYALDADGVSVYVRSYERFGPLPFLFNREKQHPAVIVNDGMGATYLNMPLLGDIWRGDYTVQPNRRGVRSILSCAWANAWESIVKSDSSRPTSQW